MNFRTAIYTTLALGALTTLACEKSPEQQLPTTPPKAPTKYEQTDPPKTPTKYEEVAAYFREHESIQIPGMDEWEGRIEGRVLTRSIAASSSVTVRNGVADSNQSVTVRSALELKHRVTESVLVDEGIDGVVDRAEFYVGNDSGKPNGTIAFGGANPRTVGAQSVYESMINAAYAAITAKNKPQ